MYTKKIRSQSGVTLIELLVAAVIALICTGAALELYITQQQGWLHQENITDMQQNGRAAIDEIVFHLRQAGYHVPQELEALFHVNSDPDTLTIVYVREPMCNASLTAPMPLPSTELKCEPDSVACFEDNTWAYIYDPTADIGEFFLISHVQAAAGHLQHNTMPLSRLYPAGSLVFQIDFITFYIDNSTDSLHPRLMMERQSGNPQIYADNIEDLNFRFKLTHGAIVDSVVNSRFVREIEVFLVARTDRHDLVHDEEFIRDTFATKVFVRNLSF